MSTTSRKFRKQFLKNEDEKSFIKIFLKPINILKNCTELIYQIVPRVKWMILNICRLIISSYYHTKNRKINNLALHKKVDRLKEEFYGRNWALSKLHLLLHLSLCLTHTNKNLKGMGWIAIIPELPAQTLYLSLAGPSSLPWDRWSIKTKHSLAPFVAVNQSLPFVIPDTAQILF